MSKLKNLEKNNRKWVYAALGAALGGFVMAPHIGAAIGASMGLAGAAGTSAGLAVLGGGSVASGGLGMLGGTYLVAAASSAIGMGAGKVMENLADSGRSPNLEALKLSMTVDSLSRYQQDDVLDMIRNSLDVRVRDLASTRLDLSSEASVNSFAISKLDREMQLLCAVVPKKKVEQIIQIENE